MLLHLDGSKCPFLEVLHSLGRDWEQCLWRVTKGGWDRGQAETGLRSQGMWRSYPAWTEPAAETSQARPEEARMLRPKWNNSKPVRRKGPAEGDVPGQGNACEVHCSLSWARCCWQSETGPGKENTILAPSHLYWSKYDHPLNEVFVYSTVPVCRRAMHTAVLKRNCWLTPFPKVWKNKLSSQALQQVFRPSAWQWAWATDWCARFIKDTRLWLSLPCYWPDHSTLSLLNRFILLTAIMSTSTFNICRRM